MRYQIILVLILSTQMHLGAQTISRKVLSTMGGTYQGANFQATYTVGETIITTMSSGNLTANQGFQQPACQLTYSSFTASAISTYTWNTSTYTSSGAYTQTFTNFAGCDSIVTLNLTVYRSSVTMTILNVVQTSPNIFQYDVILTNTGNTTLGLQGYTCGINHATGMRNGGTLTHTFLSREASLSALPNVTAAYTSSTNHLRLLTGNATAGNQFNMAPGTSIRLATMRVSNSVPFPADFVPALSLQTLIAIGKTPCVATCIATPPGNSYGINGTANTPATGTLQALTGVVNTPCLYLNPSSAFAVTTTQTTLTSCSASPNISAQVTVSGSGSTSLPGTYSLDAGPASAYTTNSFSLSNLSIGTHSIIVTSGAGCTASGVFTVTQPGFTHSIVQNDTTICLGSSITLNAVMGNGLNSALPGNLQNGLLGWWPFNGNANDESGNGNNGTVNGATLTADRFGNGNSAYSFDGVNDFISTSDIDLFNSFTISAWINPIGLFGDLISKNYDNIGQSGYEFIYNNSGTNIYNGLHAHIGWSGNSGNNIIPIPNIYLLNSWNYCVFVRDSNQGKIFINGILAWNQIILNQTSLNNDYLLFGASPWGGNFLHGTLDDIGIWNRALTQQEITQLYTAGNGPAQTYLWSTGDTTSSINVTPNQTTTYYCTVSNGITSCTDSVIVSVINPVISAGTNQTICLGDSVTLTASGATTYTWSHSVTNGTSFSPSSTQTYTVTGTNSFGCTATSQVTVTVNPKPNAYVTTTGPTTFCNGNSVILNANGGNGLTYQWYKTGNPIAGATSSSYQVNHSGNYWAQETNQYGCSATSSPQQVVVNNCDVSLDLKLYYQGYYAGSSSMAPVLMNEGMSTDPTVTDTILIELHSPLAPYGLVRTKQAILHTNGHALCSFEYYANNYYLADSYYVAIRHRNGLTTWSANPILFTSTNISYDFTTSSTQAYGDNMTEVEPGIWALYAGELNYDENIDLLDNAIMETDIGNFAFGYYITDLNGDGNTDLLDGPILEMNIYNFIFSIQLPWSGTLASVSTNAVTAITSGSALSGGVILSDGGSPVLQKGVCWSLNPHPTVANNKTMHGGGNAVFTSSMTGLLPSTTYYIRAYSSNGVGTVYGSQVVFTTTALTLPTLNTTAVTNITYTTASSGGSISSDGGAAITARGVCWSTSSNPTVALSTKTTDGSGIGSFTSSITGLVAGTTYYLRAYATNTVGTSYGNEVVFTTTALTLPTLTTTAISNIATTTANSGGSISSDGGAAITARGVCWSTSSNPTVALSTKTIDGSGTGSFTSSITGLVAGTTYYVRAYATNSVGTAYGSQVVFTTTNALTIGQSYQGGIIAYILQPGDPGYDANVPHGLIAAPSDQSTGIVWWNGSYVTTGATATALGTGNANTNTIVAVQGNGSYAAKLCYDLVLNGYSDWYLPSKDELNKLYLNKTAIGFFAAASYWSSSEYNNNLAWSQYFDNGYQYSGYKTNTNNVRAVRAF